MHPGRSRHIRRSELSLWLQFISHRHQLLRCRKLPTTLTVFRNTPMAGVAMALSLPCGPLEPRAGVDFDSVQIYVISSNSFSWIVARWRLGRPWRLYSKFVVV